MKSRNYFVVIILIVIVLYFVLNQRNKTEYDSQTNTKTKTERQENPLLLLHAGGYMVIIEGQKQSNTTEMFVLIKNGIAEWKWIEVVNGKANILAEKNGTWTATENSIKINIIGNTGSIEENYTLDNGKFKCGSRVLIKTN